MTRLFLELESQLEQLAPEQIVLAEKLAECVVDPVRADANECWEVIWNKPLFANMLDEVANRKYQSLKPLMTNAWQTIGQAESDFRIIFKPIARGTAVSNFSVEGTRAKKATEDLRVAPHRLFAIQGGAAALRKRVKEEGNLPYLGLVQMPLEEAVNTVMAEMGRYWGRITSLHFLTDLGLACKPDVHLVRTAQALGMIDRFETQKLPNLDECIEIYQHVSQLAANLYGSPSPARIRYLDKVLMEISRQGIIAGEDYQRKFSKKTRTSNCRGIIQ